MPEPTDYSVEATPACEDIANALQIATLWADRGFMDIGVAKREQIVDAHKAVARLLRHALDTLEHR